MKTILITGSTDGIGKLVASKLAQDQHQIILHGRNSEKLGKTIAEIKELSNNENISGVLSDLSDFDSIKTMLIELNSSTPKIDVLINNAGVFKSSVQQNKDGLDLRFAVNYFAPYILTNGLLPLLKKSDAPRVINLSSAAQSPVAINALLGAEKLTEQAAYAQSKLALTMWSFNFAKANPEIITIAVNPGSLLNTRMANEAYGQHWSPATKGSDILYELAIEAEYKNHSGEYFDNDQGNPKGDFADAHNDAYDQEKINTLLTETDNILKK
jgi:NAD(P)-dependent dehydrogenase (short-subunit alcohol dehydrogenase family)